MKILAVCKDLEDCITLKIKIDQAIVNLGLINIKVGAAQEIPDKYDDIHLFITTREFANGAKVPRIMIINDIANIEEIQDSLYRLFTIYNIKDGYYE